MSALAFELDVIIRMGPAEALASPIADRGPHPFCLVEGNPHCGACGGGILHRVHAAQQKEPECQRKNS